MADLKQYVKEETNMDSKADRPDITQESLKNQTCSPKNNTSSLPAQLSSDSREEAASGAQPTPFVHTGIPAVPRAGDALPTGALVNGPASHPTSDEPSAPNKGGVSPRKAPPAESAGRLSSPRAPDPPGALRPDALKNAAGPFPDTPPGRPGANGNGSEALRGGPPSGKSGNEAPTGQTGAGCVTSGRTMWDFQTESSENSSDDCGPGWGPRKRFARRLWIDCRREGDEEEEGSAKKAETVPPSVSQRWRKRKVDTAEVPGLSPASKTLQSNECPSSNNGVLSFRRKPGLQSSMDSSETVVAIKQLIARAPAKKNFDGNGFSQADGFSLAGGKFMQPKTESSTGSGSEEEPSFFPCTKCNVNFEEKRHLHRHMTYHLDGHNQARHVNAPQPFICKECGRSFRDRGSLLKHMTIHQERREKLMEEIKGLSELQDEGRAAGLQCPQCVFGTSCPKTFVQHAKTHEKDKRRHVAATEREPETHPRAAHRVACAPGCAPGRGTLPFEKNEARVPIFFSCRVCPFSAQSESTLVKHVELAHRQLYASDFERPSYDETNDYTFQPQFPRESQKADSQRLQLSPKFCIQRQAFRKRAELPFWSDLFIKSKSTYSGSCNIVALFIMCFKIFPQSAFKAQMFSFSHCYFLPEKSEITKKVCLHCNATFPSAVSLSNHLRAYARRKRAALLEGTSYDCKQKKPRSRPGPKKKIFALPHSADEIYRLTCRFCDLVFQGPLSVQEDWIKHLQRHIMNASVPCTGAGMVEVTALPAEPPSTPEETAPPLVPQAAS
ncbi:zinc finger protein 644-like [Anguilla rostrata]|uniref:zinc finger protein 644-like n=1 Tax=Anguilla rostrata TaxID=7938 RepID=UPI0030D45F56